jgi:hypothetical protein
MTDLSALQDEMIKVLLSRQEWDEAPQLYSVMKNGEMRSANVPDFVWSGTPAAQVVTALAVTTLLNPAIVPSSAHPPDGWIGVALRFETWFVTEDPQGSPERELAKHVDAELGDLKNNPDRLEARIMIACMPDGTTVWAKVIRGQEGEPQRGADPWTGALYRALQALATAWAVL